MKHYILPLIVLNLAITACGSKNNNRRPTASATLQFAKTETPVPTKVTKKVGATMYQAPADHFEMKLIAAYISENIDQNQNNVGQTSMFYLNPECGDDIMHCDVDPTANGGLAEDGNPWTHIVNSFFDFSNLDTVNQMLNLQGRPVEVATYRYVRLEFCKYAPSAGHENIKWGIGNVTGSFAQSACNVTAEINPPIEVQEGNQVTVTLSYTLDGAIYLSASGDKNCSGNVCFQLPKFTPSASK